MTKIIAHTSVSLDGSYLNFEPRMDLHYRIAGTFYPEAHLIGSNTAKTGIQMYGEILPEEKGDFERPDKNIKLPYWIIPDSGGILKGMLHLYRKFEYCRDVIVLVSNRTPEEYIKYLNERNYNYIITGQEHVNIRQALKILSADYRINTILIDSGSILVNHMLGLNLLNEISVLIHPVIVGQESKSLFHSGHITNLTLTKVEKLEECVWSVYKVGDYR